MEQVFSIPRASKGAYLICGILVAGLAAGAVLFLRAPEGEMVASVIGTGVFGVFALFFAWLLAQLHRCRLILEPTALRFEVPWYSRRIALDQIDRAGVRLIDDAIAAEWKLTWRINGIGLPGFLVGWFSSTGRKRVLAARTQGVEVLIPTTKGFTLLVSLEDPKAFLDALHGL